MSAQSIEVHAAASVTMVGGGGSAYVSQSGAFTGVITDTATGNITLLLQADKGIDATESYITLSPRGTLAPSGLQTLACAHTSDTSKTITALQEDPAGAASILADVNFDIVIYRNKII